MNKEKEGETNKNGGEKKKQSDKEGKADQDRGDKQKHAEEDFSRCFTGHPKQHGARGLRCGACNPGVTHGRKFIENGLNQRGKNSDTTGELTDTTRAASESD